MAANDGQATTQYWKRRRASDWSELPPEVLRLIYGHLISIWDYVRFRGVCSSWRFCARPSDHTTETPSLLLPYDPAATARSFFDPSDRSVHTIHLPEARGKWIYGTPYGWLVMLGKQEMADGGPFDVSLLNPITRDQILLPPLPRQITTLPEQQSGGRTIIYSTKILLTGNPVSSQGSSEVLLALLIFSKLVFCRLVGPEAWSVRELSVSNSNRIIMDDFTYFDGAFFVADNYERVTVISVENLNEKQIACADFSYVDPKLEGPKLNTLHLVEEADQLFLVNIYKPGDTIRTEVRKLERGSRLNWVEAEEQMSGCGLFVSQNHSSISFCPPNFTWGGRGFILFACDDSTYDDNFGNGTMVNVRMLDIVSRISYGGQPYYWKDSRRAPTNGKNLIGLSWIIPSLS